VSKKITINTAEDVDLNYEIAGPGSRIAAGLIDLSIIWTIVFSLILFFVATGGISLSLSEFIDGRIPAQVSEGVLTLIFGAIFILNIAYFIFFEKLRNGQTIGKRAIGLRVVNDNGQILGFSESVIRNIARIVDFIPGPYFVGLVSVLISSKGQRLGDLIAGTIVIKSENFSMPLEPFLGMSYSNLENTVYNFQQEDLSRIGPRGFQILTAYFQRKSKLHLDEVQKTEQQLADNFATVLGEQESKIENSSVFLKELYLCLRDHLRS
jgi:uncharacterized RDD family membrane protein YckC